MFLELFIVLVLILVNGVLAMAELAIVSSRPARLRTLADKGSSGAKIALNLSENPGRFLSAVQIGITLVGVLSGAFSGATLGGRFSEWLRTHGLSPASADALGVLIVVVTITYLSLIIGELVPKQIALRNPENVASRVAPLMAVLAKIASPLVWFLDLSGRTVLRLLGQTDSEESKVTEEEVRTVLSEAQSAGVIETGESAMLSGVMRLADRNARGLMTPRRDVEMVDLDATEEEVLATLHKSRFSKLPVRDKTTNDVPGVIFSRDVFEARTTDRPFSVANLMREVPVVSDRAKALDVVEVLRRSPPHIALIFDEYGEFEGIVTTGDVLEAIAGVFDEDETGEPALFLRDDGSYLIAGWMSVDEFSDRLGYPRKPDADYATVAGLVLDELQRMPALGDTFERHGWKFEVVDLDERRIDKVLVIPPEQSADEG
ncbi:hemolysin family protein [Haematobacter genomosp. 1]|uniref:DNA-binding protein n=1 Tax=Haematobacter genomosp. 1 TaxID=366618 RepID=A0A212A9A8_9RHOB|nr:hemolysin family protein [Haematobacter genomosp. 1]OWJ76317.1 DNA-binding protein [Haematobacter genomosp. 1]